MKKRIIAVLGILAVLSSILLVGCSESGSETKKETIGIIGAMGDEVASLKKELDELKNAMLTGADLRAEPQLAAHADWAEEILRRRSFTPENAEAVLQEEVGEVFEKVLEDAGVFKRDEAGREAFLRFIRSVGGR